MTTPSPDAAQPQRLEKGPGASQGPLSPEFPEVEIEVSSSFAHDRGMVSSIESLSVGGKTCHPGQVLQELVTLRQGWTRAGESGPDAALGTVRAFVEAWAALFPHAGRLTGEQAPEDLQGLLGGEGAPDYHPPRVALHDLDDGDQIAAHAYFRTWDGGNHGTQFAYAVEAYRVSDGSAYELAEPTRRGRLEVRTTSGPQPVDPNVPRPQHLSRF